MPITNPQESDVSVLALWLACVRKTDRFWYCEKLWCLDGAAMSKCCLSLFTCHARNIQHLFRHRLHWSIYYRQWNIRDNQLTVSHHS